MANRAFKTILLLAGSLLFIYSCTSTETVPTPKKDRYEIKHEPSDEFFLQRMNPDGSFPLKGYTNALKQIKNQVQPRTIDGFDMEWTTQGPGNIGARINSIAVHPTDENTIYLGFSKGGVFKTTNGGITWNPIFDSQVFLSIGDVALDPSNPEIVYVGTGDMNITGIPFIGDGVYRSTDGGDSWTHLGLEDQRVISEIIVDPTDPNKIFAATMGLPFEKNNDRGLYRSTDNGTTWEQVLFLSDSTGVIDIEMHPNDPQTIYATGWDRIRNNFTSIIDGYGAKIYKTTNGGDNWDLVEGGLPNDSLHGRTAISICENTPDVAYVQYVGDNQQLEAIYRTDDGGVSWDTIPIYEDNTGLSGNSMGGFGWYFGKIRVNPNDPDDIYLLGVDLWRTKNAGITWERASPEWWTYEVHADKHDLVFLQDGGVLLATDGGLYRSDADNLFWEDLENIPTTQFYRVAYNPHEPTWYYGGAQDNGTTGGNETFINQWPRIFGGDGFQAAFDPEDPDRFFVETQRGRIRVTLDGGGFYEDATIGIESSDRRNWDMPYFISPHFNLIMYTGTEKMYVGVGDIPNWTPISEDLTDGDDGESRNRNITAIDESPLEEGLLYAGTGDGNLWRGDGGGTIWTDIVNGLPDQYVTDVVASPSDVNTVYVTYSGFRDNDFLPRIHRSNDQGQTWENISANLPDLPINELLVLPETGDSVMFVATDGGVYGTVTSGEAWERLGNNMPVIAVFDLVVNEFKNELVAGTFARSIMSYPLDSIMTIQENPPVSTTDPKKIKDNGLKVFPTLAQELIQLEIANTEPGRKAEVVIVSLDGKLVYQSEKLSGEKIQHQIDVSNLANGQYFVKVKIRHRVMSQAFVKQ